MEFSQEQLILHGGRLRVRGPERRENPALPVDQRAVTVEREEGAPSRRSLETVHVLPRNRYVSPMSAGEILSGVAGDGHRRPNPFAGGGLDRATHLRADPRWLSDRLSDPASRVVPVWRERSLVSQPVRDVAKRADGSGYEPVLLPPAVAASASEPLEDWIFLGLDGRQDGGRALFAADVSAREDVSGEEEREEPPSAVTLDGAGEFLDLRGVGAMLG
ncbi:MAG: hypothetical protein F4Y74_04665, partial [Gemmatimonadales bacterium]|nr:hypothetical protein [Gemmatimonadales bacterium]